MVKPDTPASSLSRSAFWKAQLRTWHWISSAICLAGLLLFAVTGFTLNHAASIEARPVTVTREAELTPALLKRLEKVEDGKPLPADLAAAVEKETQVDVAGRDVENRDGEVYIDLPGPGVDSYLSIDMAGGTASYEHTSRGVLAVLNDLHKGRDAGPVWGVFIDLIAIACILFAVTGLGLLWVHARGRTLTWPLTTLGVVLPVILFILFVHS
ncbi:MAG: PepSY-associated TM helix domain-containing protein [Sphingobium sp.]